MKQYMMMGLLIAGSLVCRAQELPAVQAQQLENETDLNQSETEDDAYLQVLENFRKTPLNLNKAAAEDLQQLQILSGLQVDNFILYRNLLGPLQSIYELQAIPSWDVNTIRKLLLYVKVVKPNAIADELKEKFNRGENSVLLRIAQVMEPSAGFKKSQAGPAYLGSPQKLFFRYDYNNKKGMQAGCLGDKDAGEQFFRGAQRQGFDFYSAHFFIRDPGIVHALALGDFSVNMGQGLIQWQGLAFKKSADVMNIKRQSSILNPYNSAGEINFQRGAGITLQKGRNAITGFASIRKLDANTAADTIASEDLVSSILTSGYHRSQGEIAKRYDISQKGFGANYTRLEKRWHVGVNAIFYHYSAPLQKKDEPYNLYAITGRNWYNASIDYSATIRNMHFFGESAVDKGHHSAFVHGLMLSVDPRVDICFLQRIISKSFQSIESNAFTENSSATNETGFYTGVTIRPADRWRLDAYIDVYKFPWLKYNVGAPANGHDILIQIMWDPSRQVEAYARFNKEIKEKNLSSDSLVSNYPVSVPVTKWQQQLSIRLNRFFTLRNRIDLLWYENGGPQQENGFLFLLDLLCNPASGPFDANLRLQYFETTGYNSRLYAYEDDVLYSYSIPAFFGKGYRYYININYHSGKKIAYWFRWAQLIYPGLQTIGTGLDEIKGNKKTELKLQVRYMF